MSYVAVERADTLGAAGVSGTAPLQGPETRRRRPSGWHLLLVPVALLMIFPFVWLIITSASTLAETRVFPPTLPAATLITLRLVVVQNGQTLPAFVCNNPLGCPASDEEAKAARPGSV